MGATTRTQTIEEGDIFFFYRPRVETEHVSGRRDVQRFYMVLAAKQPQTVYRLFVIGRKKLPTVIRGKQHPERRNWALNVLSSENPEAIRRELMAVEYPTETKGERHVGAAKPIGEGKYQLLRHKNHTEIAYALELPRNPGHAQEEFEVLDEASYIVSIKNPDIGPPGAPSASEPPRYPKRLWDLFGDRRWIDVDDPELLNYENTEILLIAAHAEEAEEKLGIRIDQEKESLRSADVCRDLRIRCEREPTKPLLEGEFPDTEQPRVTEVRWITPEESPSVAGKAGGEAAARRAPSASAIARLLGDIDFPKSRAAVVAYARQHQDCVDNPDEAMNVLKQLPDRRYESMADVASALGEIR